MHALVAEVASQETFLPMLAMAARGRKRPGTAGVTTSRSAERMSVMLAMARHRLGSASKRTEMVEDHIAPPICPKQSFITQLMPAAAGAATGADMPTAISCGGERKGTGREGGTLINIWESIYRSISRA